MTKKVLAGLALLVTLCVSAEAHAAKSSLSKVLNVTTSTGDVDEAVATVVKDAFDIAGLLGGGGGASSGLSSGGGCGKPTFVHCGVPICSPCSVPKCHFLPGGRVPFFVINITLIFNGDFCNPPASPSS